MTKEKMLYELNRIQAIMDLMRREIEGKKETPTLDEILEITGLAFKLPAIAITSDMRNAELVAARSTFCHVARRHGYMLKEIGKFIKRDHSSVKYLLDSFNNRLNNYGEYSSQMLAVINQFK